MRHLSLVSVRSGLSLQIAKVEKLKPLEVELRRLEDLSESIVNDFAYMKKREEEMRDTNGKTQNIQCMTLCRNYTASCFLIQYISRGSVM